MQMPLTETHLSMLQIRCCVRARVCVCARTCVCVCACVTVSGCLWAFLVHKCIYVFNEDLCLWASIVVQLFRCVCVFVNAVRFALQRDWQQPLTGLRIKCLRAPSTYEPSKAYHYRKEEKTCRQPTGAVSLPKMHLCMLICDTMKELYRGEKNMGVLLPTFLLGM